MGQPHSDAQAYFDSWSDTYTTPTILMRSDLWLIWRNGAADRMLSKSAPFYESGHYLHCVDRGRSADLKRFLGGVTEPDAWVYPHDGEFWILRAEPLTPPDEEPALAVMFYCHRFATHYVWADFGRVFGLTRSETEVAKGLIGGASAEDLAENLSVSIATIRTHIKRTYAKMGVNNREQMFAILMQFRLG